jgi:hypothetical protein
MSEARQPLKQKAGYQVNGTALLIASSAAGFRASRRLIQTMY